MGTFHIETNIRTTPDDDDHYPTVPEDEYESEALHCKHGDSKKRREEGTRKNDPHHRFTRYRNK